MVKYEFGEKLIKAPPPLEDDEFLNAILLIKTKYFLFSLMLYIFS